MSNLPGRYTLTPMREGEDLEAYDAMQRDAQPDTVARIAAIVAAFDGNNQVELAQRICAMIFEGEPIEDA